MRNRQNRRKSNLRLAQQTNEECVCMGERSLKSFKKSSLKKGRFESLLLQHIESNTVVGEW